jgi:desulfoferrodoxin (superoxide reductase-like protein)
VPAESHASISDDAASMQVCATWDFASKRHIPVISFHRTWLSNAMRVAMLRRDLYERTGIHADVSTRFRDIFGPQRHIQWIYTDSVGPSSRLESIEGGSHVG